MNAKYNKQAVTEYILAAINGENYEENPTTPAEKLAFLDKIFREEYGWMIERTSYQNAMREWLQGLPSAIDIEYRDHEIIKLAYEWGSIDKNDPHDEHREEYIVGNWFNFMAHKIMTLIQKGK